MTQAQIVFLIGMLLGVLLGTFITLLVGCTPIPVADPTQGGRCYLGFNEVQKYEYVTCIPTPTETP